MTSLGSVQQDKNGTGLGGSSLGGGTGTGLGGTGTGLGGSSLGGSSLGGTGTGLGGTGLGGTGLGGSSLGGTGLGGTGTGLGGSSLGGSSLGGTGLGGSSLGGTGLGGTGTGLGSSSLGGSSLGGTGTGLGGTKSETKPSTKPTAVKEVAAKDSKTGNTKADQDKKQATTKAGATKKGPAGRRSKIAELIKKQKEEEEKALKKQAELQRLEEEKIRKEEEEAKKHAEEEAIRKQIKKEEAKKKKQELAKKKIEDERKAKLIRLGVDPSLYDKKAPTTKPKSQAEMYGNRRRKNKPKPPPKKDLDQIDVPEAKPAEEVKPVEEVADSWEDALDDGELEPLPSSVKTETAPPTTTEPTSPAQAQAKPEVTQEQAKPANLRSPICCILGHVDTGKTSLLDKIRRTNVQGGEAGGITQQIGATYIPQDTLKTQTKNVNDLFKLKYKIPGLLVIDTPGHESFTNLRSRGSSLCDIAVLVVDIMHGIEPQTKESIQLLKMRKTPFIVALNKIDRIYGWKPIKGGGFRQTFESQNRNVQLEFEDRLKKTIAMFAECSFNAELYTRNTNYQQYVSLVPTSAVTCEGIPDLLALITKLTESKLTKRITELSVLQATVLEVKVVDGLGYTIDVILSNGSLREGDRIILCGLDGPIDTYIRALLTPHPLKEIRVKTAYLHHKEVKAAQGVKIAAPGLDKAVAGSELYVVKAGDNVEELKERVQGDLTDMLKNVQSQGVSVQASTLGSLEALLCFLKTSNVPVSAINIGPVHKSDVIRASVNLESNRPKEYACILAFDVTVERAAQAEADKLGVKIFKADIIYHLFDAWEKHIGEIIAGRMKEAEGRVVFPCILEIMPHFIIAQRNPIILGVKVIGGIAKPGTPVCIARPREKGSGYKVKSLGKIISIENNHQLQESALLGAEVAVRIEGEHEITFGRHFDEKDLIYSVISRESIDALKETQRTLLRDNKDVLETIKKLKSILGVL